MGKLVETGPLKNPSSYRPSLREVPAELLTPYGWIDGTVVFPEKVNLVDHLTNTGSFLKLTRVRLPARRDAVPFFALQSSAAILVIPLTGEGVEGDGVIGAAASVRVTFFFASGALDGELAFNASLRLSDYLRQQTGFIVVRDAYWTPSEIGSGSKNTPRRGLARVLVNVPLVIGVEETEPRPRAT